MIPRSVTAPAEWDGRRAMVAFRFRPMSPADAEGIAHWHYPDPFSFYDWTSEDPDDRAKFLDPTARSDGYVAVDEEAGSLIGWFHFKRTRSSRSASASIRSGRDKASATAASRQGSSTLAARSRPSS